MSDAKPTAAPGPAKAGDAPPPAGAGCAPRPPRRPSPRVSPAPGRWLERFSAALLVAATAVAVASAAPALLNAAGTAMPRLTPEPDSAALPLDLGHQPPEILANPDPIFDPDHDSDGDELPGSLAEGAEG